METPVSVMKGTVELYMTDILMISVQVSALRIPILNTKTSFYILKIHFDSHKNYKRTACIF